MNVERLKKLIDQSEKSIHQIQVEAELNSGQLYRILNGTNKTLTFETAEKLADALGVSLDEFRKEESLWE
ncbi:TPA: helix-turn-helix domain-containing protein [Streptococcus suis]